VPPPAATPVPPNGNGSRAEAEPDSPAQLQS